MFPTFPFFVILYVKLESGVFLYTNIHLLLSQPLSEQDQGPHNMKSQLVLLLSFAQAVLLYRFLIVAVLNLVQMPKV